MSTADHKELNGFILDTIPAYNRLKPFHPKRAGGVGKPEDAETFRTLVDPDIQVEINMLAVLFLQQFL